MTLRVIGSHEIVQQVFWLDARTRTCGVKLRHPETGHVRCAEMPLANIEGETAGKITRARVVLENALGAESQVILIEE